jgi:hypothetical protein
MKSGPAHCLQAGKGVTSLWNNDPDISFIHKNKL